MEDTQEKTVSSVVKLDTKTHTKGKVEAAKTSRTVAEVYAEIITNYFKGRR